MSATDDAVLATIASDPGAPQFDASKAESRLDEFIPLTQAADELPSRRRSRKGSGRGKTTVQCLYRWTNSGCRGIKLQFVQIGATRCTTRRWLAEFFEALTLQSIGVPETGTPIRTPAARRKAVEKAKREFKAMKP